MGEPLDQRLERRQIAVKALHSLGIVTFRREGWRRELTFDEAGAPVLGFDDDVSGLNNRDERQAARPIVGHRLPAVCAGLGRKYQRRSIVIVGGRSRNGSTGLGVNALGPGHDGEVVRRQEFAALPV